MRSKIEIKRKEYNTYIVHLLKALVPNLPDFNSQPGLLVKNTASWAH